MHLGVEATFSHLDSGLDSVNWGKHQQMLQPPDLRAENRNVLLVRDPRDICVSLYFEVFFRQLPAKSPAIVKERTRILNRFAPPRSLDSFVRSETWGVPKVIRFQQLIEIAHTGGNSQKVFYEDLVTDPSTALTEILDYVGIRRSSKQVGNAIAECEFSKMKADEAHGSLDSKLGNAIGLVLADDPRSAKVREGLIGGHRNHLSHRTTKWATKYLGKSRLPRYSDDEWLATEESWAKWR
ncbi:sulfotransferase [Pontimonas sp.]|nr:sulfotransferase domain-containing protein [Pontimonas sp.]MDA9116831.1 sulfotransferase [Pontimonas sp.]